MLKSILDKQRRSQLQVRHIQVPVETQRHGTTGFESGNTSGKNGSPNRSKRLWKKHDDSTARTIL